MNIVCLDGYTLNPGDLDWAAIHALGNFKIYDQSSPSEGIIRGKNADIVLVNKFQVTREVLSHWPSLQCLCITATGYNNLDMTAISEKGIVACNAVGYSTYSTAQHTMALILEMANKTNMYADDVKNGGWTKSNSWTYSIPPTIELNGLILGVFGLGDIGMKVAHMAQSFGMSVIANTRNKSTGYTQNIAMVPATEIFEKGDFISLHLPLNEDSKGMINRDTLALMKSSAYLINTSRGGLIVENDLEQALIRGEIAGVGLDVLNQEPPNDDHLLIRLENSIVTPHIAWATKSSRQRLLNITVDNIKSFIQGNPQNLII